MIFYQYDAFTLDKRYVINSKIAYKSWSLNASHSFIQLYDLKLKGRSDSQQITLYKNFLITTYFIKNP